MGRRSARSLACALLACVAVARCAAQHAGATAAGQASRTLLNTPSWHPKQYRKQGSDNSDAAGGQAPDSVEPGAAPASGQAGGSLSHAHAKLDAALAGLSGPVPSWWECTSCLLCTFGPDDEPPPAELHGTIGSCPVCSGCTHHLEMLNLAVPMSKAKVKVIRMHYGNTGASLFLATDAGGTEAVLKLHGVATPMVTAGKMSQLLRLYRGRKYLAHELLLARSLATMADECGLGHINIREWVTGIRAVLPVTGEKIDEPRAVLAEYARGVSLEMLTLKLSSADLLDALAAVPHAALRDAALFDVLFVQGDRHAENVFLGDDGYFKLIDSRDQALDVGLDSVFFASTISFERNRVGNEHLFNHSKPYVTHHWPQNTLDYRCHVPGGAIGMNYPPKFKECIAKWADSSPNAIAAEYFSHAKEDGETVGAPSANYNPLTIAARLYAQSLSLRDNGFEGTLQQTNHKNATGLVPFAAGFPVHEPCCAVELTDTQRSFYKCSDSGRDMLPAEYVYPPLNMSAFLAKYPHTPMPEMPPLPKLTEEQTAILAENRAKVTQQHKTATPVSSGAASSAPLLSAAENKAAWVKRVGREDVVDAGGDVFEQVPASGFDKGFRNPCWQNATGLFCIPFFHIIGVSKCGTTDLFRRLSLHPHVAPSHNKGPHFWDERHTFDWYLNIYATSSVPVVKSDPANVIIGDASSNTLTFSGVGIRHQRNVPNGVTLAKVLAALQPGLRLIAVLRNPVDRLYSSYFYYGHYAARYGATAAGFHDFAVAQVAAYAACPPTKSRRECAVEGYGRAEQLVKGMYSMFLPDYLAAFPREQVLVMRSETYGDDVEAGLRAAMKHIGLEKPADEQWSPMVDAKRSNKRGSNGRSAGGDTGDMMRSDTRQLLNAFYQSYNVELATLLDDNSFMWHTQPPPSSQ